MPFQNKKWAEAVSGIFVLPVIYHSTVNITRIVEVAKRLGRQSAYDAAYISLAESLNSELWTLDGPLYRNARDSGFNVHLLN